MSTELLLLDIADLLLPPKHRGGGMREQSTIKNRSPRRIHFCPSCGRRMHGLATPKIERDPRTKEKRVLATHRCAGTKDGGKRVHHTMTLHN